MLVLTLILELIGLQIFMSISAFTTILNMNYIESKEKANRILQMLALFICLKFFIIQFQAI
jgi:hypothetical protein